MTPEHVFLDANVLFSASLGGESFALLWAERARGAISLCTSPQCVDEAHRNLTRKRPQALDRLAAVLGDVTVVAPPSQPLDWAGALPEDDAWVLAGAVHAGAHVLLTGNTRHFGALMSRGDLPIRVRTVRAWLEGR